MHCLASRISSAHVVISLQQDVYVICGMLQRNFQYGGRKAMQGSQLDKQKQTRDWQTAVALLQLGVHAERHKASCRCLPLKKLL